MLDEKAAAVAALGTYAGDMGVAFGPYIEAALKVLLDLAGYFHELVRCAAFDALPNVIAATQAAFPAASGTFLNWLGLGLPVLCCCLAPEAVGAVLNLILGKSCIR